MGDACRHRRWYFRKSTRTAESAAVYRGLILVHAPGWLPSALPSGVEPAPLAADSANPSSRSVAPLTERGWLGAGPSERSTVNGCWMPPLMPQPSIQPSTPDAAGRGSCIDGHGYDRATPVPALPRSRDSVDHARGGPAGPRFPDALASHSSPITSRGFRISRNGYPCFKFTALKACMRRRFTMCLKFQLTRTSTRATVARAM